MNLTVNTQLWSQGEEPPFPSISPSIGIVRHTSIHGGYTGALVQVLCQNGKSYYEFYLQDGEHTEQVYQWVRFDPESEDADHAIRRFIEKNEASRREDAAEEMRREIAMEQGMLHGCDAYNDAMGW